MCEVTSNNSFNQIDQMDQMDQIDQRITQGIQKIKELCTTYAEKTVLKHTDFVKLLSQMLLVYKTDPKSASTNLNFVKIVFNPNKELTLEPEFFNPSNDFNNLIIIISQVLQTKKSQFAIRYWDGIRYKDGISFQIYGTHNASKLVSASRCYEEVVRQYNTPNGPMELTSYKLLE